MENVVYFENEVASLREFVDRFVKSNITLAEELHDKIEELGEGIEEAAKGADKDNPTLRLCNQLQYITYYIQPFNDVSEESTAEKSYSSSTSPTEKSKKPYYKPKDGKKKDGTWDARTKIGKAALAQES